MRASLGTLMVAVCLGLTSGQSQHFISECNGAAGTVFPYGMPDIEERFNIYLEDHRDKVMLIVNVATF